MFDILLSFVEKNQNKLIELYLKERNEKGEGLFTIILNGKNVDIRYYKEDNTPYPEIQKEYKNKQIKNIEDKIEVKDKWIVTLPILEIESDKETVIPVWNLVLDDGKNQVFFQGFPQEVKLGENKGTGLQYVLVAEPHSSTIAKNNWTVEATTTGQKYLEKCLLSSKYYDRFLTFRSDSDICKIILPGTQEEGVKIMERIENDKNIQDNLDNFRKNDKIGSPFVYKYKDKGYFSPNTLKYINTYYELKESFGDMTDYKILEFGGGYGGLCHILSYVTKWKDYDFVEIKEPLELSKKCFMSVPVENVNCLLPEEIPKDKEWDLFISEFSFCELNEEGQNNFMFLLENSKNAYLSMNLWDTTKKQNLKNKLLSIFKTVEEYPVFLKSEWGDYVWICKK